MLVIVVKFLVEYALHYAPVLRRNAVLKDRHSVPPGLGEGVPDVASHDLASLYVETLKLQNNVQALCALLLVRRLPGVHVLLAVRSVGRLEHLVAHVRGNSRFVERNGSGKAVETTLD